MAKEYRERPSNLIDLSDPYEAYCFDEAVYYIRIELEREVDGKYREPRFPQDTQQNDNNQSLIEFLTQQRGTTVRRNQE